MTTITIALIGWLLMQIPLGILLGKALKYRLRN